MRLGPLGEVSVTVAVTLPVLIFDAATTEYRQGSGKQTLSDCVHSAIAACMRRAEPKSTDVQELGDDHIPF